MIGVHIYLGKNKQRVKYNIIETILSELIPLCFGVAKSTTSMERSLDMNLTR